MVGGKFFKNKWVSRYSFQKIVLYHEIINKIWSKENQENSAHRFGDNYLTNHLVKFLEDTIEPWRVGALRVCTGDHFL